MMHPLFLIPLAFLFTQTSAQAETVHAVVAVHRHGDRTWKGDPPTKLTSLGKNQCVDSGTFFRDRYLDASSPQHIDEISEIEYNPQQIYASTPNQPLLVTSSHAILQGLYPPINNLEDIKLHNGETVSDKSGGQQFAIVYTISTNDPDTIWLKGDDLCPQYNIQGSSYPESSEYLQMYDDSLGFYQSLKENILAGVFPDNAIGYQSAYQIYDYINVARLYNKTVAAEVTDDILNRLRILADAHEWALNGNVSEDRYAMTISGQTLAHKVVTQLESNINPPGKSNKFSLFMSSYDIFLAFFGLTGLIEESDDFHGLPHYASTMVFELVSHQNATSPTGYPQPKDLFVKFYFRNGTAPENDLTAYPLFRMSNLLMPWDAFSEAMDGIAVRTVAEWCNRCSSKWLFCPGQMSTTDDKTYGEGYEGGSVRGQGRQDITKKKQMSLAVAGVIGAAVTLGLGFVLVGLAVAVFGVRFARSKRFNLQDRFRGGEKLPSEIDLTRLAVPQAAAQKI